MVLFLSYDSLTQSHNQMVKIAFEINCLSTSSIDLLREIKKLHKWCGELLKNAGGASGIIYSGMECHGWPCVASSSSVCNEYCLGKGFKNGGYCIEYGGTPLQCCCKKND